MRHEHVSVAAEPTLPANVSAALPPEDEHAKDAAHVDAQKSPPQYKPESPNEQYAEQIALVEKSGDLDAFWKVAAGFYPELVTSIQGMMRRYNGWLRDMSAEDVAADAILKVFGTIDRARSAGNASFIGPKIEYFMSAASSILSDQAKSGHKRKTKPRGELVVADEHAPLRELLQNPDAGDAYERFDRRAIAAVAIEKVVGCFSDDQRRAALDYFLSVADGGPDPAETQAIASKHGLTLNALKAMVYRARQRAKELHRHGQVVLPDDPDPVDGGKTMP
jgi:DNA-directed RNA polymerase specialized sigma24 family protein